MIAASRRLDLPTLSSLLSARAELTPHCRMLVDSSGDSATFSEFERRVDNRVGHLVGLGITSGDVVCWQLPNAVETSVWSAALSVVGARQAPIPMAYRQHEIEPLLLAAQPTLIVTAGHWRGTNFVEIGRRAAASVSVGSATVIDGSPPAPPSPSADWTRDADGTSMQYLYATSGTTGVPRLAMHCDRSLLAWVRGQSDAQRITDADVVAYCVSMAHVAGFFAMGQALTYGSIAVIIDGFHAGGTLEFLAAQNVTVLMSVPTVYTSLVAARKRTGGESPLLRLRFCGSGAAPKPPQLHADVQTHLGGRGLLTSYGMTEAGAITAAAPEASDDQLEHTVGEPVAGMSVRVVGSDGYECDPETIGEVRVAGASLFGGYFGAELTGELLDDGYLSTGDLGVMQQDGCLRIVGRLKDLIIRKGESIVPQEVEDVLHSSPVVREAVVLGVPDADVGERVCAVVLLNEPGDALTLADIDQLCREHGLMPQKIPQSLHVCDEVPRTPTGKPNKNALRNVFVGLEREYDNDMRGSV